MKALAFLALAFAANASGQVRFDGSDDVLYANHDSRVNAALNFTNEISVSFWVSKEAGLSASAEFLGKGRLFNGNNLHWSIRNSSDKFEWTYASPSSTFHIFTTTATYPQTNVWIHVGYSTFWGNSNSAALFINGVRVAAAWTAGASHNLGVTNAEPFEIGRTYAGSNARCRIMEVAVWNAQLGDDEMRILGTARVRDVPRMIRPAALRLYLPMHAELFPPWTAMSGSNALVELSPFGIQLTPLNSPQQRPNDLLSSP